MSAENVSVTISCQPNAVAVTTYVDGYSWRCEECGWLGVDHTSQIAAIQEAGRHWDDQHPELERGIMRFPNEPASVRMRETP